ncbi:MAG TPA: hypothetical protein VII31_06905 [Caldimonas sp.]
MKSARTSFARAAAVAGALALTACASADYHYSQLYGYRYHRTPIDTYSVTIVRVDGKDTVLRPVLVDPGPRKIVVQGPPGGTKGIGQEREIDLNVEPCTRYYLVAVKENRLASDFTVRVDYQEPVGGCTPPTAT